MTPRLRWRPAIALLAALLASAGAWAARSDAATIVIVNQDAAGEGFNDPTPVTPPLGGNPGATLGARRLNAFTYAANLWAAQVTSNVTIQVDAKMDPLSCNGSSATLGSAGTITVHRDFTNAPHANTWYPQALADKLSGVDQNPANNDIRATFNSAIGTTCPFPADWYYGYDGNAGGDIDFVSVVMHEIGHGLGFQTFVTLSSGAKFLTFDDVFMRNLEDHDSGLAWPVMTNAQRQASAIDTGNLHWTGSAVVAAGVSLSLGRHSPSGHVRMNAPNPLVSGSSVSHWDTFLSPDEMMEPNYTTVLHNPSLARDVMTDIGWGATTTTTTAPPTTSTTTSTTSTTTTTSTTSTTSTTTTSSTTTTTSTSSTSSTTTSSTTTTTSTSSTSSTTTSSTTTSSSTTTTQPEQGADLCPATPLIGCRASASQRVTLVLRRGAAPTRNVLRWRVVHGALGSLSEVRNPVSGDPAIAVCLYDASAAPQPLLESSVPPGGTCNGKPCWKHLSGAGGYRYRNKAAAPDGITDVRVRVTAGGELQLVVKGKGTSLPLPPLGLTTPVIAQLVASDATGTGCWEAEFRRAVTNDGAAFKASGP